MRGDPQVLLPILHSLFLESSPLLAHYFASRNYKLVACKDSKFIETIYRIARDEFNYRPSLTQPQFFALGFAERKIIMLLDLIDRCTALTQDLQRQQKLYSSGSPAAEQDYLALSSPIPTHDHDETFELLYEPSYIQHEWREEMPRAPSPPVQEAVFSDSPDPLVLEQQDPSQLDILLETQPQRFEELSLDDDEESCVIIQPKETIAETSSFPEDCMNVMNKILEKQDGICMVFLC